MEELALELEQRDVTGKAVKRLRREGLVPAVIHDHGKASVVVMGSFAELTKAYQRAGKHHPVSLKAGSKHYIALIKQVDFDPKKHQLRHVVFNAVKANEKVTAEIPIRIKLDEGNDVTPAERAGFVVLHQSEVVEVEALPKYLPEVMEFDGEKLVEIGDQATVADLIALDNVVIKSDPTHSLATVFEPSALQAANDAAGGTDDEVTETENPEGETVADAEEAGEETAKLEGAAEKPSENKKD